MPNRLSDILFAAALRDPLAAALRDRGETVTYGALAETVEATARGLVAHGLGRQDRVAVWLEKCTDTVVGLLAAAHAGGAFVPVNPVLKPRQVAHILTDCNVRVLVTSAARLASLAEVLPHCPDLRLVLTVDAPDALPDLPDGATYRPFSEITEDGRRGPAPHRAIDTDMAAILYTSGSTGLPKGVVLSHRNMLAGAESVASYLENRADDVILAALPLSFDAGFSQLTTAFTVGARVVLLNYLLPRDVVRTAAREGVTGLTGVPPLWVQLAEQDWPAEAADGLRYIANTGGAMPRAVLGRLRDRLPRARVYLMYGLTEAFRSTYLPPSEVDKRPESIGKAVPNAEIMVVRPDGSPCAPGEPGELVHRGAFVAMGYWNDPERTAQRFRPAPGQTSALPQAEMAVWSGDTVKVDDEGYLTFVGRRDEMIKTSGYRVSPTEVEEAIYASGLVGECAALGVPDAQLGQAIVVIATAPAGGALDPDAVIAACRAELPGFMVPRSVLGRDSLPRNPNGKIDRKGLADALAQSNTANQGAANQ